MTTATPERLRARLNVIAHSGHPIAGPLMAGTVDTIIPLLGFEYGAHVLDIGCGAAEWLIRLIDRTGCNGEGFDTSEEMLAEARSQAEYRLVDPQQLVLRHEDARLCQPKEPYDAAICTGSTHAVGGLDAALALIARVVRPGGRVLLSEGFWEQPPSEAQKAALGGGAALLGLAETLDAMVGAVFAPLYWHVISQAEWDDYESMWSGSVEKFAIDHPDDADAPALVDLARRHRDSYLKGYRGSLGYVTCILSAPKG